MTVSISRIKKATVPGAERRSVSRVTMDSSYPAGGELIVPSALGLNRVDHAVATVASASGSVDIAQAFYDPDTSKLRLLDATPAEVADGEDVAGVIVEIVAWGS